MSPVTRHAYDGRYTPAQVVLYSNKGKTSTLYKSLSMRFAGRAAFAEVRESSAKEVVAAAGVSSLPALKVIAADGTQQQYEGQLLRFLIPVKLDVNSRSFAALTGVHHR